MLISLSSHNPSPLYAQIVEQVRGKILSGELPSGTALPSIRQLAVDLLTSVITTKRAYQELEREGLIVTRPGSGTFVATLDPKTIVEARRASLAAELQAWVDRALAQGLAFPDIEGLLEEAKRWRHDEDERD